MKKVLFETVKGKENSNELSLYFLDKDIRVNQYVIILKCPNKEVFDNTIKFLYSYVCNSLHNNLNRLEIRIPRDTIQKIEDVPDNYFEMDA